ncbi:unnamed protein product [Rhizophagus irregularis]|nr:unnamed protein product [Rhizophagus irregularis]
MWMKGLFRVRDDAARIWTCSGPIEVILKRLNNIRELIDHFINNTLVDSLGTTYPMFVFRNYYKGGIYSFLESHEEFLNWKDIVVLLWSISSELFKIHDLGLIIYGHLHGGNILIEYGRNKLNARITHIGLHRPFKTNSKGIFGSYRFLFLEFSKEVKNSSFWHLYLWCDNLDDVSWRTSLL